MSANRNTRQVKSSRPSDRQVKSSRPSDRLNPKTVDPFRSEKPKTQFSTIYNNGGIPCRLIHGSVQHKLQWDIATENVLFDPVLVFLAEGLRETLHPYSFIARTGFKELLQVTDVEQKLMPILVKVIPSLRSALVDRDGPVFIAALDGITQISNVAGPHLNIHLKNLLGSISRRILDKNFKDPITETLQQLEMNGGMDASMMIKSKVPTYCSVRS